MEVRESCSVHVLPDKANAHVNEHTVHTHMGLHDDLRSKGYAYLACPEDTLLKLEAALESVRVVFDSAEVEEKKTACYSRGIRLGRSRWSTPYAYAHSSFRSFLSFLQLCSCTGAVEGVQGNTDKRTAPTPPSAVRDPNPREFLDIMGDIEGKNNFSSEENESQFMACYSAMQGLALQCLEEVIGPLGCDSTYVASLMGPSETKLRLIRTYYSGPAKETCMRHTDMGLLTVAVCWGEGLELQEVGTGASGRWVDVEASAPLKPCLVLFAGQTLQRLTGGT
jgi:isopenicillin N synthase-like dioxygenase